MTPRDLGKLGCALLLGAGLAFPAGLMLGGGGSEPRTRSAPQPATETGREMYSPKVLSDPHFLQQQRQGVEALEAYCRETGEMCAEARSGRRWLDERVDGQ